MEPEPAPPSEEATVSALRTPPAGLVRVGDLPVVAAPAVPAHLTMSAARKIAELKRAPLLLAERDGILVGVIDERALLSAADDSEVAAAMKRLDHCLTPTTTLARARELLLRTGADALPVAAGALLLGVVTRAAIERAVREPAARADLDVGRLREARRGGRRSAA
jgi:CBS domain-containing protein